MNQNFSTTNYFSSTQYFPSSRSISQSSSTNSATPTSIAPSPTKADDADRFKTEICRSWSEFGKCKYAARCKFAHGTAELREVARHPRYKTAKCKHFHSMEVAATCSYGSRCHFIHGEKDKLGAQSNNSLNKNNSYTKEYLLSALNVPNNSYYSSSLNSDYSTSSNGSGGFLKDDRQDLGGRYNTKDLTEKFEKMEIGHWGDVETNSDNVMDMNNTNYIYSQCQLQLLKQLLHIQQYKCQLF